MVEGKFVLDKDDEREEILVGLDWLISQEQKPVFLEFNLQRPEEGDDAVYSRTRHFLGLASDKIHQHQIFGGIMPECALRKEDFDDFLRRHSGRVVYKARSGSMGNSVSVLKRPTEWEPDLLEEFVAPRTKIKEGKHFSYIIRDYIMLGVDGKNLSWRRKEVFRKVSKIALEDEADPNLTLKLNTGSGVAERGPADEIDIELVNDSTPHAVRMFFEFAQSHNWNGLHAFKEVLVGHYLGYRIAMFQRLLNGYGAVVKFFEERNLQCLPYSLFGGLAQAFKAAEYGSDLVLLTGGHSFDMRGDGMWERYCIERNQQGEIVHRFNYFKDPRVFETFQKRSNVIINEEIIPENVLEGIARRVRGM